ncbi:GNAT family N-acetyltransferase [Lentibacillus saliphilus]|uniref:GNAT family N-acetyltransferase n=1 Tax=Lentibacillus saliphilus TaxID=2737028 RepID=UPI001C30A371|nr:GNAT family N-acetyltransferase [Lentibacillus saliphilus]
MILELDKAEFSKCRSLINDQGQLEAIAVVEKINPGRIFVDNVEHPTSGIIWLGNNDGFIFFGNEQNEGFKKDLNHFVNHVIAPEAKKIRLKWFEAIGNHEKWNKTIENVFKHRKLGKWNQKVYTIRQDQHQGSNEPVIEQGYNVIKISNTLLDNTVNAITNIEFIQSKILEFWPSTKDFLSNGIGYCAIFQDEVVNVCFSGFVANHVHCIDIETLEAHRGKKLAQITAYKFVTECLENKMIPYWDCMEMNKPSVAVAEKIGLINTFNYVGYEFPIEY